MIRLFLPLWFSLIAHTASADILRMAVTTSFENSGLAEVLLPAIESDTNITVQLLVVGTGQALRLGEAGDVDAVLVHARAAEEAFVAAGHAPYRREIMYNDFVLVGPAHDPAAIAAAPDARTALSQIAATQQAFVSRGDDSGTHKAEQSLWPEPPRGDWYLATGSGMGAALNTAAALDAYILTDRASWLTFGNPGDLTILLAGDPALFNQYAYLPVSADKGPHIRTDLAQTVETWLTSPRAAALIDGYRLNNQPLFTFNAKP